MATALLIRPADEPTPWTAAGMRELYRQSQWTRFFENCLRDRLLFVDLVAQGMGSIQAVVVAGQPCSLFTMAPHWVRGLEVELAAERAAKAGA